MNKTGFQITQPAVINFLDQHYQDSLLRSLEKNDFKCYVLDGSKIHDKKSFLNEIGSSLLDVAPIAGWDEFGSLYKEWLIRADQNQSALIWPHVQQMLNGNLDELIEITDILTVITRKLYSQDKVYLNFFLGEGPNFPKPAKL